MFVLRARLRFEGIVFLFVGGRWEEVEWVICNVGGVGVRVFVMGG